MIIVKFLITILLILCTFQINFVFAHCPSPEVPENGRLVDYATNTTTINYECDSGFILVGGEKRTCQESGSWSGATPVCALNVALNKPAIQSSTKFEEPMGGYHANYSTDGNFEGVCSSTVEEKITWWQVDLLQIYKIFAVELMIPSNFGYGTNNDHKIHILTSTTDDFSPKSKTASLCYKHDGTLESNRLHTFICIKETNARYVRVIARNAPVHLCEVVVLSTSVASEWQCPPGTKDLQLWAPFNGVCYYGSYETAPWFVAKNKCIEIGPGASLATDVTAVLQQFFISQIRHRSVRPAQFYWLGVSNVNNEWRWVNGNSVENSYWADPGSKDVAFSSLSYGVALTEPFHWNWMASLQAVWYNWICQSSIKFCTSPTVPLNGGVMTSGQMRSIGTTIFYYCNKGYVIKGDKSRSCQDNGIWSKVAPSCEAVDCGHPDVFFDIRVKYLNETKTTFGTVVEYECPAGQKLTGSQLRRCQADGKWSEKCPRCVDIDCGYPDSLKHGKVLLVQNATSVGSIAEYACDNGFGLSGSSVRHCSVSGLWIPVQIPSCNVLVLDLNSLQSALEAKGFSQHQTSLMTGFIVAIVILLIVLFLVVFWIWKKKKLYDTFSMSTIYGTNSHMNLPTNTPQDVLYAFPSTVTTAISAGTSFKESSHYYPPSNSSSASTTHYGVSLVFNNDERQSYQKSATSLRHTNSLGPISTAYSDASSTNNIVNVDQPEKYLTDSIKKREIERVLKDIQLSLPFSHKRFSFKRAPLQSQFNRIDKTNENDNFTWKKSNIIEYMRQKWSGINTLKKLPPCSLHAVQKSSSEIVVEQRRPSSPTLSELFSFDDEDDDEAVIEEIYSVVGELRAIQNNVETINNNTSMINPCGDSLDSSTETKVEKIYDVPPDAARLNDNLARVLLKQIKVKQNKIYDTPCEDTSTTNTNYSNNTFDYDEVKNNENLIEVVQTYC